METYFILTLNQHLLAAEFQSRLSFKSRLYQILPPGCSFPILKDRYIIIQGGVFLTVPPNIQYQNEKLVAAKEGYFFKQFSIPKTCCSQRGLLFQAIFNVKKDPHWLGKFFHFGSENRRNC